jgi:hypothetical protein
MEDIGASLASIAITMSQQHVLEVRRYEQKYPAKKAVTDATVTHLQTEDEALRESQGASDESNQEWAELGPREVEFQNRKAKKAGS